MTKKARVLTPLERRIMRVLWDGGAGNVQRVLQGLTGAPQLAYTTVQTTLNLLQRKGKVKKKARWTRLRVQRHRFARGSQLPCHQGRLAEGFSRVRRRPSPIFGSEQAARCAKTCGVAGKVASQ
jgi:hypothetical protein